MKALQALARDQEVVVIDNRGQGFSKVRAPRHESWGLQCPTHRKACTVFLSFLPSFPSPRKREGMAHGCPA